MIDNDNSRQSTNVATSNFVQHGIKPSKVYLPHDKRFMDGGLLGFFAVHFAHIPIVEWQARFAQGLITTESGEMLTADMPYPAGQTLLYYRHVANEPVIPFEPTILHIDNELLVVDKPHFLPVIPTGQWVSQTLLAKLRIHPRLRQLTQLDVDDISPIHRLDKDTAGVMLLSLNPNTRAHYQRLFEQKQVQKTYEAIAPTRTDLSYPYQVASRLVRGEQFYLTQEVEGEANAFTTIDLIENRGDISLYRLYPKTGKKHQLRVHMMSLNMPLLNDALYPVVQAAGDEDYEKPLKLLAKRIEFIDPFTHQLRTFESLQSLSSNHAAK